MAWSKYKGSRKRGKGRKSTYRGKKKKIKCIVKTKYIFR